MKTIPEMEDAINRADRDYHRVNIGGIICAAAIVLPVLIAVLFFLDYVFAKLVADLAHFEWLGGL